MPNSSKNRIQELKTPKKSVKLLIKESYIETVKKSVGSNLFQNLYAEVDSPPLPDGSGRVKEKTDILQNGRRSCAVFISRILFMFKLIHDVHASVYEVVRDLESSGWEKVYPVRSSPPIGLLDRVSAGETSNGESEPQPGDVLVYETKKFEEEGDEERNHAAFYIGNDEAVSTFYKVGQPIKHHYTYGVKDDKPISVSSSAKAMADKKATAGEPVRKIVAIYRYDFEANHEKILSRRLP